MPAAASAWCRARRPASKRRTDRATRTSARSTSDRLASRSVADNDPQQPTGEAAAAARRGLPRGSVLRTLRPMSEAPDFVHLRTRTHYSLLSAPFEVADLVATAAADGQRALALTDNGNLFGAIEFFKACKGSAIKPILGQTTFVAGRTRRQPAGADNPTHEVVLLAQDAEGFANLRTLASLAWLEGFSYRPRVDLDLLAAHARGLIAFGGAPNSAIGQALQQNDAAGALAAASTLRELFGHDNFFLE